jgi:hypothetical protein
MQLFIMISKGFRWRCGVHDLAAWDSVETYCDSNRPLIGIDCWLIDCFCNENMH